MLFFEERADLDALMADPFVRTPTVRLRFSPWTRHAHAAAGALYVHADIEIEGLLDNCWSLVAAERVLTPVAWVDRSIR